MKIRATLIGLSMLAAPVLTACSDEPAQAPAESVGVESTYCVDAEFNIVDEDYCESDESEFDPVNYMWWLGITPNPLGIGQQIHADVANKGHKVKPSTPAKPSVTFEKPATPSKAKPSTVKPAPKPSQAKPAPKAVPAPKAPSVPKAPAPAPKPPAKTK